MTRTEQVLAALAAYPVGVPAKKLRDDIGGVARETLNERLRNMRKARLVCSWPRTGGACKWCLPCNLPGLKADHARIKRERALSEVSRKAADAAAKRVQRMAAREVPDDDEFYSTPIMRIVPAHSAPTLRPRGPCSVWRLAA